MFYCLWSFRCDYCVRVSFKPVNDAFAVQEHESRGDLRCVETRPGLLKLPGLLDVEHEIAAVHELHHEEETVLPRELRDDIHACAHANHSSLTGAAASLHGPGADD